MADKMHNTSQSLVGDIKSGLHGIHGAGEALRGGAMEALDGVFHKKDGEAKDRAIYDHGVAEMRGTESRFEAKETQSHQPPLPPREEHHGFGHHEQAGHGQGSHFIDSHAKDAAGGPHHGSTGMQQGTGLGAAQAAWQQKH